MKLPGFLKGKRVVVTAVAVAMLGSLAIGGAAPASASARPATTGSAAVTSGRVLVKEIKGATGVLDVYKLTGIRPDSDSGCSNAPDERVCMYIDGSGLFVNTMENETYFDNSGTVNMRLTGPSVWMQTGNIYESGGWWEYSYTPYANLVGGSYCAVSFTYYDAGSDCQPVHS